MKKDLVIGMLMIFLLASCGARKTNNEKHLQENKTEIETDSAGTSVKVEKEDVKNDEATESHESDDYFEYEGGANDSVKIRKTDADGKLISETTIIGSGKLKTGTKAKKTKTQKRQQVLKNTETKIEFQVKSKAKSQSKTVDKIKVTEREESKFAANLFLILWIILALILIYLNHRFKWISFGKKSMS